VKLERVKFKKKLETGDKIGLVFQIGQIKLWKLIRHLIEECRERLGQGTGHWLPPVSTG
jgi:hypothetical protein